MVLFFFAFLAGIFTVLSPCILPVLPALLATGTMRGKWHPLGVIVGLVSSFAFFTLALTALVEATGISPNVLRIGAIVLIFLFGLVMLFPRLSDLFARLTSGIASAGQTLQARKSGTGFWGGALFGIALGLLWTPCAGPILASITTLVATHALGFMAIFLTLTYSVGAGIPLFLIAYGSGKILHSSRFLAQHSEGIRRFFGAVMMLLSIALAFHWEMLFEQKLLRYVPSGFIESSPKLQEELKNVQEKEMPSQGKAPEFVGITEWINSPPLMLTGLQGKVVLVDFWTYSCINCLRTLPHLIEWDRMYREKGLVIVGVHTPEFEFEKDADNVRHAVASLGIRYPVALDNQYATWLAYHNHYWPAHYLIDQEGAIRSVQIGEGGYIETENAIRGLLSLEPLAITESAPAARPLTQETYLGFARGHSYAPDVVLEPQKVVDYTCKSPLQDDLVCLQGPWEAHEEYILAVGENSRLELSFLAKRVYLVLAGAAKAPIQVFLDGVHEQDISFTGPRKYDIASTSYGRHLLSIHVPAGIRAYAFTFGDE